MSLDYDALLDDPSPLLALWEKHGLRPRRDSLYNPTQRTACLLGVLLLDAGVAKQDLYAADFAAVLGLGDCEVTRLYIGFDVGLSPHASLNTPPRLLGALIGERLLGPADSVSGDKGSVDGV